MVHILVSYILIHFGMVTHVALWILTNIGSVSGLSLFGAKPLLKPMMIFCQSDPLEQMIEKSRSTFFFWKCIWKCHLQTGILFVQVWRYQKKCFLFVNTTVSICEFAYCLEWTLLKKNVASQTLMWLARTSARRAHTSCSRGWCYWFRIPASVSLKMMRHTPVHSRQLQMYDHGQNAASRTCRSGGHY